MIAPDSIGGGWSSKANEDAVLAVMDHIIEKYDIDRRKVLVTGFSMGGAGTWHFAQKFPQRFSAAIPMAARPGRDVDLKIPAYVIHSRADELIPIASVEAYVQQLQAAGCQVQFLAVDGISHRETERFRAPLRQAVPWVNEIWSASGDG